MKWACSRRFSVLVVALRIRYRGKEKKENELLLIVIGVLSNSLLIEGFS